MLAVGVILLLVGVLGGGFIGYLSYLSHDGVEIGGSAGIVLRDLLPITVFAAGALSVLLLWIGWALTRRGLHHRRAERKELKRLRASGSTNQTHPVTPPESSSTSR